MKMFFMFLVMYSLTSDVGYSKDFRDSNWGMTKEQVKKTETGEISQETGDFLAYNVDLAGYDSYVIYIFTNNKLTRAKYLMREEHSNKNQYITDYDAMKSLLSQKYGKSSKDEVFWRNELYKDDYSDWGFAISLGHLVYYSSWETETTSIFLLLNGENYNLNTEIEYQSKALEDEENHMREVEALEHFTDIGFRNSKWGASIQHVKESEKLSINDESGSVLVYKTAISNIDVLVGYLFTEGKLTSGRYLAQDEHSNKNEYITDYNDLKALLEKKFGQPSQDKSIWKNDLYKDDYSDWGFALSLGHLVYFSTWENSDSEIMIILTGENYDIQLMIEYVSIELKEFKENSVKKKALDSF